MDIQFFERQNRPKIAFASLLGQNQTLPTVIFLGGFRSDMTGTKAVWLDNYCRGRGQAYLRFDYTGHGQSDGKFEDQTISLWAQDALDVIEAKTTGPLLFVGSSMGGWISLLIAPKFQDRLVGIIGVAAAPDFTTDIRAEMTPQMQVDLDKNNIFTIPSGYSPEPYPITRTFLDDGDKKSLLGRVHSLQTKLRLLHGQCDTDVDWHKALAIRDAYPACDTRIILIDDGDHRLVRRGDLGILGAMIDDLPASPEV